MRIIAQLADISERTTTPIIAILVLYSRQFLSPIVDRISNPIVNIVVIIYAIIARIHEATDNIPKIVTNFSHFVLFFQVVLN